MRLRFSHFNIRDLTLQKLRTPDHPQVVAASEIIREAVPDILSINEIQVHPEAPGLFRDHVLEKNDNPLRYPYHFLGATNSGAPTGLASPFDQKGFGLFEGQYGMALFSRFPIAGEEAKSFERFSWRDLPGALSRLGDRVEEIDAVIPLFSTNLLDVPVRIEGRVVHAILLHASVPVKGPLNRERNADQLSFLNEYVSRRELPGVEPLKAGKPFVVMGDLNADPEKGEGIREAIKGLLDNPCLNGRVPSGPTYLDGGGVDPPPLDAQAFSLKLDYILPSREFRVLSQEVFWPTEEHWWHQARRASDHFLVTMDCEAA